MLGYPDHSLQLTCSSRKVSVRVASNDTHSGCIQSLPCGPRVEAPWRQARAQFRLTLRMRRPTTLTPGESLLHLAHSQKFATVLADPPWRFSNRTGKMAPEHKRLARYQTMTNEEIMELPVSQIVL